MTQKKPAPAVSYRAVGLFWSVIIAGAGSGAVILQTLGPLPHPERLPPLTAPARAVVAAGAQAAGAVKTLIAAPDPALMEPAPDFPGRSLPFAGPSGRAPGLAYAAHFDPADKHPRVALVVDGAGLDQADTERLMAELPPAVDVAFSPYTPDQRQDALALRARQAGHECLQSIPMEPSGYPLSEEGPRALLTGADREQNRLNLEWALSRFPGCAGATGASDGLAGERYAQNGQGYGDLLNEVTRRGLIFLDARTGAPALATAGGSNIRVVDMVVDQSPSSDGPATAEVIDQRLAALEHTAQLRGAAIGLAGPPRPVMLERIALWAHGLAGRGVTLAPLSAMPGLPPPPPMEDAPPPPVPDAADAAAQADAPAADGDGAAKPGQPGQK